MHNHNNNGPQQNGFLMFVIKTAGAIAAILAVGLVFAFTNNSLPLLLFTIILALVFFVLLMLRWDTYKKGEMFFVTAVCINIEHVSMFETDYVFETLPDDEDTEPRVFTITTKRTKFKKYRQGIPYIMAFGMKKYCRDLTAENLVTTKKVESYGNGPSCKGYIDLDDLDAEQSRAGAAGSSAWAPRQGAVTNGEPAAGNGSERKDAAQKTGNTIRPVFRANPGESDGDTQ